MMKRPPNSQRTKPIKLPTGKFEEVMKAVLRMPPPKKRGKADKAKK